MAVKIILKQANFRRPPCRSWNSSCADRADFERSRASYTSDFCCSDRPTLRLGLKTTVHFSLSHFSPNFQIYNCLLSSGHNSNKKTSDRDCRHSGNSKHAFSFSILFRISSRSFLSLIKSPSTIALTASKFQTYGFNILTPTFLVAIRLLSQSIPVGISLMPITSKKGWKLFLPVSPSIIKTSPILIGESKSDPYVSPCVYGRKCIGRRSLSPLLSPVSATPL